MLFAKGNNKEQNGRRCNTHHIEVAMILFLQTSSVTNNPTLNLFLCSQTAETHTPRPLRVQMPTPT
jgi:hypothetical protein